MSTASDMHSQILATMMSDPVRIALSQLEKCLAEQRLTHQQGLAAVALLAARQISVLPPEAHINGGDMVGAMVEIGLGL